MHVHPKRVCALVISHAAGNSSQHCIRGDRLYQGQGNFRTLRLIPCKSAQSTRKETFPALRLNPSHDRSRGRRGILHVHSSNFLGQLGHHMANSYSSADSTSSDTSNSNPVRAAPLLTYFSCRISAGAEISFTTSAMTSTGSR